MSEAMSCDICGGPRRRLWHCMEDFGPLRKLLLGNKVELLVCPACGALWCYACLGDGPVLPVAVPWPYSRDDWQRTYDLDDGESLRKWFRREVQSVSLRVEHPCRRKVCRFRTRRRTQTLP